MDLKDTPEIAAYRAQVRAWIEQHADEAPAMAGALGGGDARPFRDWQRKLAEAGLVGVTWPEAYGGAGKGPVEQVVVNSELARAGCPSIIDHIAVGIIGPTIQAFGTDAQKERFLGPLLHGDEGWCQLFSEPAAGSDLAGIQARAVPQDDGGFRLGGQKVWTTLAHFADHGMLIARTDPHLEKHKGLSMFLVDMRAPGVTVRPLRQIHGGAHFNEVFFDDVELPADALLGPLNGGWGVAMTTLMFERLTLLSSFETMGWTAEQFVGPIVDRPEIETDTHLRQRIASIATNLLGLRYSAYRALTALSRGDIPGPEAGLSKIGIIEGGRLGAELVTEVLGPDALEGPWGEIAGEMPGLRSAGGTEEVLRNLIGERVLGLPPEPRADKGIPFSELSSGGARKEVPA